MTKTNNPFTVRLGNRLYANKILLDKWIDSISGNKVKKKKTRIEKEEDFSIII